MSAASPFTSDFHQQFEAETAHLLRRRFMWFTGLAAAVGLLTLLFVLLLMLAAVWETEKSPIDAHTLRTGLVLQLAHTTLSTGLYAGLFLYVWKWRPTRHRVLALSFWAIVIGGSLHILRNGVSLFVLSPPGGVPPWTTGLVIYGVLPAHVIACAFLPWTPAEAARPIGPLVALNALLVMILPGQSVVSRLTMIVLSPFAGAPGVVIAWLKHTRRMQHFKVRFLQHRYGEIRRELVDARRIHEALFPRPIRSGPIRLDYRYEPMQLIGGDYLYARSAPARGGEPPSFNVLLLDVTGHGIAAALTVNRLYGEVERLYAEDPDASPGDVLRALNRYVHLTLATHSVYATALCLRLDPARGLVEYASGGHPPAFLRGVDGTLEELTSTAFVLGACPDSHFDPAPQRRPFGPGDALIAYTDGAIEAMNESGRFLGVAGLQRVLAARGGPDGAAGGWTDRIMRAVEAHRLGPPRDDTIVVEITRPLDQPAGLAASRDAARAPRARESVAAGAAQ